MEFQLQKRSDGRYILINRSGDCIDDAQGYGYKSAEKARKAGWWKFKGGEEKINSEMKEAYEYWKDHLSYAKDYYDLSMDWFKEIARGEITMEEIQSELNQKYNITPPEVAIKHIYDLEEKIRRYKSK